MLWTCNGLHPIFIYIPMKVKMFFTLWKPCVMFPFNFSALLLWLYFLWRCHMWYFYSLCHNPSLGLTTKARACKVVDQEGSLGVKPHALESARECEGIDLRTPKWTPTLGVGVLVDSRMFRERLQRSKPNGLKSFLYPWKILKLKCLKWARMTHLDI
jgi:hypothetical protein